MITQDPKRRAARLGEVTEILKAAPAEDRDLLIAMAPVMLDATPDRIVFGLTADAMAARIKDQFRFIAREIPPAHQLYKGVPGIHVAVRNPTEGEWVRKGPANGIPHEITVVQTHTPDVPFVYESLKNYFRKAGIRVFTASHPIFTVRRQWEKIVGIGDVHDEGSKEVYLYFQIERIDSKERLHHMEHEIFSVLKTVFTAVEDFADMQQQVRDLLPRLRTRRGAGEEATSAKAFLEWILADNYVFFGTVKYRVGADGLPDRIHETANGVFTDPNLLPVVFPGLIEEIESRIAIATLVPKDQDERILDIDYCNNASAIHQLDPVDDIVAREWSADGTLHEVTVILGRFSKSAFTFRAEEIPLLREKRTWILANSGTLPKSHDYREFRALFNRIPTRELFYADPESLKTVLERIVFLTGDDEIAVFHRQGAGYDTLYLAISRFRYSAMLEDQIRRGFEEAFGPTSYTAAADCGAIYLLLFYFDSVRLEHPVDEDLARKIALPLVTTWEDRTLAALVGNFGESDGLRMFRRYITPESRSGMYREATAPEEVPEDIQRLENLEGQLEIAIVPRTSEIATLKLYSVKPLALTETLRTLQNLGLTVTEELRVPLTLPDGRRSFLYRFELEAPRSRIRSVTTNPAPFMDALRALDEGRATDDAVNGLVVDADLTWRDAEVLRTLRNHLLQVRTHYNSETVNGVLSRNAAVAGALMRSFAARFDPAVGGDRAAAIAKADEAVRAGLDGVKSLAEDEVLRGIDNLVRASLRTNFYQRPERPVISIKVESAKVEGMPSPRPLFEIYVHSRLIEGIHLRGGKVARGGIRWSDRHDDFRTEILGLMKTQMVKNVIIVPVGSKGGFVLKGNVPPRPALDQYLIDRYREFVSGLLDVTDNIVDGAVLHPPEVVRQDGDDPYLVVAADKGTAHLSDTANSVSAQYGFWLGDAFASGGSVGYDHKKEGITARGAWECVKHHFENLGQNIQKEAFTCAGIGDMGGDVFGNAMLLSPATRLVAAFNHAHIFIDPDPPAEASFKERDRLFNMPRSSWRDYDASLISKGGGLFDRSAKAIAITPEMRKLLDIKGNSASGEEVIRHILKAKVDLLYNGGIGTYVKAVAEEDADVGDRANDRVRVDAKDLRARVVGEGGNLGLTQRGRIEFSQKGGSINTDAVDNSGGVDMSDHEVNIKILMNVLVKKGAVKSKAERNKILVEMTDEVSDLCLADNFNQAWALTLDGARAASRYDDFVTLIDELVAAGGLRREDDAVPTREELLAADRSRGLPRPLLCVLLGHTKMWAFQQLLESTFPDGAAGKPLLNAYFPKRLQAFAEHFEAHALKREIIATGAVNYVVNNAGITYLSRTIAASGKGIGDVTAAYIKVDGSAEAAAARERIRGDKAKPEAKHNKLLEIEAALEEASLSLLKGGKVRAGVKD